MEISWDLLSGVLTCFNPIFYGIWGYHEGVIMGKYSINGDYSRNLGFTCDGELFDFLIEV
jgi:hypothetical protein